MPFITTMAYVLRNYPVTCDPGSGLNVSYLYYKEQDLLPCILNCLPKAWVHVEMIILDASMGYSLSRDWILKILAIRHLISYLMAIIA